MSDDDAAEILRQERIEAEGLAYLQRRRWPPDDAMFAVSPPAATPSTQELPLSEP